MQTNTLDTLQTSNIGHYTEISGTLNFTSTKLNAVQHNFVRTRIVEGKLKDAQNGPRTDAAKHILYVWVVSAPSLFAHANKEQLDNWNHSDRGLLDRGRCW